MTNNGLSELVMKPAAGRNSLLSGPIRQPLASLRSLAAGPDPAHLCPRLGLALSSIPATSVTSRMCFDSARNQVNRSLRFSLLPLLLFAASGSAIALTNLNVRLVSNAKPSTNSINYGDVWAENDLACLGVWLNYSANNYGVGIYSISNPAAPVLLSIYSPSPTSQNQFELGAVKNRIG